VGPGRVCSAWPTADVADPWRVEGYLCACAWCGIRGGRRAGHGGVGEGTVGSLVRGMPHV
jgi:hypothetical protein